MSRNLSKETLDKYLKDKDMVEYIKEIKLLSKGEDFNEAALWHIKSSRIFNQLSFENQQYLKSKV